jgi:hypothetical protein
MTKSIIKTIFVVLFLMLSVFFAMFPHSIHCQFIPNCAPHKYHILFGILLFLFAVYLQQTNYLN